MITYQNAMDKALDYLKGYDIPVVITLHGRFSEGWFYCYQSREYLETGEFSAQAETVSRFMSYLDENTEFDRQYDAFVSILFPEMRALLQRQ